MNEFNDWIADFRQENEEIQQQIDAHNIHIRQQIDALKRANEINYPLRRNYAICYVNDTRRYHGINGEKDIHKQFNELLTKVQDNPIMLDRVKNCINLINEYNLYGEKKI